MLNILFKNTFTLAILNLLLAISLKFIYYQAGFINSRQLAENSKNISQQFIIADHKNFINNYNSDDSYKPPKGSTRRGRRSG